MDKFDQPDKNTPEGSGKEMNDVLKKQLSKMIEQAEDNYRQMHKDLADARRGTDEKRKMEADVDFVQAGETKSNVRNIQGSMVKFLPLLKTPLTGTPPTWRKPDFDRVLDEADTKLTSRHGIITILEGEIGMPAI